MYVCPHISSEITEPNSTKFCMPPRSCHGTLNKKYLTDRSIFAKDMLFFNTSPIQINVFRIIFAT